MNEKANGLMTSSGLALKKYDQRVITYHLHKTKLREGNLDFFSELKNRLFTLSKSLGIVNTPTAEEMAAIIFFLKNEFSDFSMDEIGMAFEKNASGAFGETVDHFHCFSIIFLGKILRNFKNWKSSQMKIYLIENKEIIEKTLTENEKQTLLKKGSLEAFEQFKQNKFYQDYGNATYNFLDSQNLIPFTGERKKAFMGKAKENVIEAHRNELDSKKEVFIRGVILDKIKEIENNDKDERIISEAKRIALNVFFGDLIETGTELSELLNEK